MDSDEPALLALLNSTPVVAGEGKDLLEDRTYAEGLARALGGRGTEAELRELRGVRDHLQSSVRTGVVPPELDIALDDIVQRPLPLSEDGLRWKLGGPIEKMAAARAVIAWAHVMTHRPARLRPCGNDECQLFLIDHTKGNTARWCSMAVCGNRLKARRHHRRRRDPSFDPADGEP